MDYHLNRNSIKRMNIQKSGITFAGSEWVSWQWLLASVAAVGADCDCRSLWKLWGTPVTLLILAGSRRAEGFWTLVILVSYMILESLEEPRRALERDRTALEICTECMKELVGEERSRCDKKRDESDDVDSVAAAIASAPVYRLHTPLCCCANGSFALLDFEVTSEGGFRIQAIRLLHLHRRGLFGCFRGRTLLEVRRVAVHHLLYQFLWILQWEL